MTELTFYRRLSGCSAERRLQRAEVETGVYEIVQGREDSGSDMALAVHEERSGQIQAAH